MAVFAQSFCGRVENRYLDNLCLHQFLMSLGDLVQMKLADRTSREAAKLQMYGAISVGQVDAVAVDRDQVAER